MCRAEGYRASVLCTSEELLAARMIRGRKPGEDAERLHAGMTRIEKLEHEIETLRGWRAVWRPEKSGGVGCDGGVPALRSALVRRGGCVAVGELRGCRAASPDCERLQ